MTFEPEMLESRPKA